MKNDNFYSHSTLMTKGMKIEKKWITFNFHVVQQSIIYIIYNTHTHFLFNFLIIINDPTVIN